MKTAVLKRSYSYESLEQIDQGMDALKALIEEKSGN